MGSLLVKGEAQGVDCIIVYLNFIYIIIYTY